MQGLRVGGTPGGEEGARPRAELRDGMAQSWAKSQMGQEPELGQEPEGQPVPLSPCAASPGTLGAVLTYQLRQQTLPAWIQILPLPFLWCAPQQVV